MKLGGEYTGFSVLSSLLSYMFEIFHKQFLKDSNLGNDLIHRTIGLIRMIRNVKLFCKSSVIYKYKG